MYSRMDTEDRINVRTNVVREEMRNLSERIVWEFYTKSEFYNFRDYVHELINKIKLDLRDKVDVEKY